MYELPHALPGEAHRVGRKVPIVVVEVNIVPHHLQRDVRLAHALHLRARVLDRRVSPPAQLEAEAPQRLPRGEPDERAVLCDDVLWARSGEEVQDERPSEDTVLDKGDGRGWRGKEQDVGASGAAGRSVGLRRKVGGRSQLEQEHAVRSRLARLFVVAMLEIDRMRAVAAEFGSVLRRHRRSTRPYMFSSIGSCLSRAHIVCTVPSPPRVPTSRRKPLLATTSPSPYMLVSRGNADVSCR